MKLYRAKIHCTVCGKPTISEPYGKDDAELLARIDHKTEKGHWLDDTDAVLIEVESEEPKAVDVRRFSPVVHDNTPIPRLDEKKSHKPSRR